MIQKFKNTLHLLSAFLACLYYRFPARKLSVVGVTGTDGKTTTTHLIYEILKKSGKNVSMISTVEAVINGKRYNTGFHVTTPSPWALQRFLKDARNGGSQFFVLEVTSHALDQNRVFGIPVNIGVVTTISHEHLDYHKTLKAYRKAKAKLLKNVKYSVLNKDEKNFKFLKKQSSGKIISYAVEGPADFTLSNLKLKITLPGKFNIYNCLAAASVAKILDIDEKIIIQAISQFKGIAGRMEKIKSKKPFDIIIDFAHKPNALEQALRTARENTKKRLIVIFGCAGLRDRLKRPIMGRIASAIADYVIFTAEDPRSEDVRDIIEEIVKGCQKEQIKEADKRVKDLSFLKDGSKYFWRIPDRQEAINYAIRRLAKKGDMVIICGKGHEQSMCYGKVEYPWDEKKAVEKALYGPVKTTS